MQMERALSETYLLTLASRLEGVRCLVVLVEEFDGTFSYHKAKFSQDGTWVNAVGNLQALSHEILAHNVVWAPCNADGTDIVEDVG